MKHLYLFDETSSNAAVYGVGTYIRMLVSSLKDLDMAITIVKILSDYDRVIIENKENVRYIYIPHLIPKMAIRSNYFRSVAFIILPFISSHENNIFHYNYIDCHDLAVWLKTYFPLSKHLLTIHYRIPNKFENFEKEQDFMIHYCDRIIVLTKQASYYLQNDYKVISENVFVVGNCVDDKLSSFKFDKDSIKVSLGISLKTKIILFVGHLDRNKNPMILLKAFERVLNVDNNVHLILVGKGDYDSLFPFIDCRGKVSFTGFLNSDLLHKIYLCADLGVIPSFYEEFGYVAIEMMMHGIPIIANRTTGLAEVIENGISGDLLDLYTNINEEDSIELLSNSIIRLLLDDLRKNNYSANARKRYLEFYNVETFKDKMLEIYNGLS